MGNLEEVRKDFLKDINEIEKHINDKEENVPKEIKKIYNSLFRLFKYCDTVFEDYECLFFFVYYVIRSMYAGPDCAIESMKHMQECIFKHENDSDEEEGLLNLFNEDGSRVTLKELGIEEE